MNDELNTTDEQFIDAWLDEALNDRQPPDLTRQILRQIAEQPTDLHAVRRKVKKVNHGSDDQESGDSVDHESRDNKPELEKGILVAVSVVAVLAASLMLALWLRSGQDLDPLNGLAGTETRENISDPWLETPQIEPILVSPKEPLAPRRPVQGVPLAVQSDRPESSNNPLLEENEIILPLPGAKESMEPLTLVSTQVQAEMQRYWQAVGITPAPLATSVEISARLAAVLGIELPLDAMNDPQRLQEAFSNPVFSAAVARRWLSHITEGGWKRLDEKPRKRLANELAKSLQEGGEFDLLLAEWLNGKSENAAAFYNATLAGRADANGEAGMIRRLAAITMNVDLRCTRCHDAYIEGKERQQDYWSFTALLRRGVRRGDDTLEIDPETDDDAAAVFYETPDGRQRFAEPELPATWIGRSDLPRIQRVSDWTKTLVGSDALARGVVNSLWHLVHGQPLRGRVIDPINAPHNDALDRLEANLVDDLIQSRFDVARMLSLIIAAPVTSRGVPAVLLPENALVADQAEVNQAMKTVDAFGATLPPRPSLRRSERVAQALRSVGASLGADGQPFVAQIGENGSQRAKPVKVENLAADFPQRTSSVPVQWLGRIKDYPSQVDHLAYLAGLSRVPKTVLQAAEVTREVEDENTSLHRVWWMVRQ